MITGIDAVLNLSRGRLIRDAAARSISGGAPPLFGVA
jgi:hypothetical protein